MRRRTGVNVRAVGDVVCGGVTPPDLVVRNLNLAEPHISTHFATHFTKQATSNDYNRIVSLKPLQFIWNMYLYISNETGGLDVLRNKAAINDHYQKERIKMIRGTLTDVDFIKTIKRKEKAHRTTMSTLQTTEFFIQTGTELLNNCLSDIVAFNEGTKRISSLITSIDTTFNNFVHLVNIWNENYLTGNTTGLHTIVLGWLLYYPSVTPHNNFKRPHFGGELALASVHCEMLEPNDATIRDTYKMPLWMIQATPARRNPRSSQHIPYEFTISRVTNLFKGKTNTWKEGTKEIIRGVIRSPFNLEVDLHNREETV